MDDDGFITFFLTGTVADGRKWRSVLNIAPEFITDSAIGLLRYIAGLCKSWDEDHNCKTVRFTFERPKLYPWNRDN